MRSRIARAAMVAATAATLVTSGTLASTAGATPHALAQAGPSVVTADALPTVQINGVVWTQVIVGNSVYAGGSFSYARPAGAAPKTHQTRRYNLLAYNLTTGVLISSFAPVLNGQVRTLAASPDGRTLFAGGDFTAVNGRSHQHIAAFAVRTGALLPKFAPVVNSTVNALAATNTGIYLGGSFTRIGTVTRLRLAALRTSNGAVNPWKAAANETVHAIVLSPKISSLTVGGSFTKVNGKAAYGLASLTMSSGAVRAFRATATVRDAGVHSSITSLVSDGTKVYGTGYVYGAGGNLEGSFALDPNTGSVSWLEDCHGDSYSSYVRSGTLYLVGHAHNCSTVGGFPESNSHYHALAFTTSASGTLNHNMDKRYRDFAGTPSPTLLDWFPDLGVGSYTGTDQAGWSITGSGSYVVIGGEFPTVNGTAQQGLVRFATRPIAPAKQGPLARSGAIFLPTATAAAGGTATVRVATVWDRDDAVLTYRIYRSSSDSQTGSTTELVSTSTALSRFWAPTVISVADSGLAAHVKYRYYVTASDADGNELLSSSTTVTGLAAATDPSSTPTMAPTTPAPTP